MKLSGQQSRWVHYAVHQLCDQLRIRGPLPNDLLRLRQQLDLAVSARGSESDGAAEQSERDDLIDAFGAAELLGCSPRRVRQIARDLDGEKRGRDWVFPLKTVTEFAQWRGRQDGCIGSVDSGA